MDPCQTFFDIVKLDSATLADIMSADLTLAEKQHYEAAVHLFEGILADNDLEVPSRVKRMIGSGLVPLKNSSQLELLLNGPQNSLNIDPSDQLDLEYYRLFVTILADSAFEIRGDYPMPVKVSVLYSNITPLSKQTLSVTKSRLISENGDIFHTYSNYLKNIKKPLSQRMVAFLSTYDKWSHEAAERALVGASMVSVSSQPSYKLSDEQALRDYLSYKSKFTQIVMNMTIKTDMDEDSIKGLISMLEQVSEEDRARHIHISYNPEPKAKFTWILEPGEEHQSGPIESVDYQTPGTLSSEHDFDPNGIEALAETGYQNDLLGMLKAPFDIANLIVKPEAAFGSIVFSGQYGEKKLMNPPTQEWLNANGGSRCAWDGKFKVIVTMMPAPLSRLKLGVLVAQSYLGKAPTLAVLQRESAASGIPIIYLDSTTSAETTRSHSFMLNRVQPIGSTYIEGHNLGFNTTGDISNRQTIYIFIYNPITSGFDKEAETRVTLQASTEHIKVLYVPTPAAVYEDFH